MLREQSASRVAKCSHLTHLMIAAVELCALGWGHCSPLPLSIRIQVNYLLGMKTISVMEVSQISPISSREWMKIEMEVETVANLVLAFQILRAISGSLQ